MSVCFETHGQEDKFWNLEPMPSDSTGIAPRSHHDRAATAGATGPGGGGHGGARTGFPGELMGLGWGSGGRRRRAGCGADRRSLPRRGGRLREAVGSTDGGRVDGGEGAFCPRPWP